MEKRVVYGQDDGWFWKDIGSAYIWGDKQQGAAIHNLDKWISYLIYTYLILTNIERKSRKTSKPFEGYTQNPSYNVINSYLL